MNKQVRLNETQFRDLVFKSVRKILKENDMYGGDNVLNAYNNDVRTKAELALQSIRDVNQNMESIKSFYDSIGEDDADMLSREVGMSQDEVIDVIGKARSIQSILSYYFGE